MSSVPFIEFISQLLMNRLNYAVADHLWPKVIRKDRKTKVKEVEFLQYLGVREAFQ